MNADELIETRRNDEIERLQIEEGVTEEYAREMVLTKEKVALLEAREADRQRENEEWVREANREREKDQSRLRKAVPFIILGVLIAGIAFRWHTEASHSSASGVIHWERDRWTGRLWEHRYGTRVATAPADTGSAPWRDILPVSPGTEQQLFTGAWFVLLISNLIWIAVEFRRPRKGATIGGSGT